MFIIDLSVNNITGSQAERFHDIVCDASNSSKSASSSGYLVTCGTFFHLARPTTDQRRQPTNNNMMPYWRWSLTGQQYSHSRQPSPCLNAYNTPSRTSLRVRLKQRRFEQLDPPWPFHQGLTVSRLVSFEPSHWESSSESSTSSSGPRICPNT